MELPSELSEQIVFNTRPRSAKYMLKSMDKPTREKNLSQPLQSHKKQGKIGATFVTGYNGVFSVTNKNKNFIFISVFEGAESNVNRTLPGVFELTIIV